MEKLKKTENEIQKNSLFQMKANTIKEI